MILCSGKVYVDLVSAEPRQSDRQTWRSAASSSSIPSRPRPSARSSKRYPNAEDIVWLQEEPLNMGAWDFFRPCFEELLDGRLAACATSVARAARARPRGRSRGT